MFSIGNNMPGYLPDADEPITAETFDEAKAILLEDLKFAEDNAYSEDEAEQFSFAAERVNHWTSPSLTLINNRVYWINEEN